jgi:hypothetical protein
MSQEYPFTWCERLCANFRLAKAISLRILHRVLLLESSIYAGFRTCSTIIK